jgi:hypothetical protein
MTAARQPPGAARHSVKPFDIATDVTLECPECRAYKTVPRPTDIPAEVRLIEIICPDCDDGDRHAETWYSAPGVEVSQDRGAAEKANGLGGGPANAGVAYSGVSGGGDADHGASVAPAARQPPDAEPSAEAMGMARVWMQSSGRGEPYERRLASMFDHFAARAVAAERERCAKIAEAWQKANNRRYGDDIGENIAAAIRNTP